MVDIHNFARRLEQSKKLLAARQMNECNKELIFKFLDHLTLLRIGAPRQVKYIEKLRKISDELGVDFAKATKEDLERYYIMVQQKPNLTMYSKIDFGIVIKRFYKWLLGKDEEYPPIVKGLKTTMHQKDIPLPNQADLLTPEDVERLVQAAQTPRDKALISCLYESGCRIGELANLTIGQVLVDQYGCVLNVNGKTGPRRVRVINSTSHLTTWLDNHPFKGERNKPLWVNFFRIPMKNLSYEGICLMLRTTFKRAGIDKPCNPHIFRHARATFMANHMTEAQMKAYFGWVQASEMASIYVHLSGRDTDTAILALNGLVNPQQQAPDTQPKKCHRCSQINAHTNTYCTRCSTPLDPQIAVQLQNALTDQDEKHQHIQSLLSKLFLDEEFKDILQRKMQKLRHDDILETC